MNLCISIPSRYALKLYAAGLVRGPGFSHTLGQKRSAATDCFESARLQTSSHYSLGMASTLQSRSSIDGGAFRAALESSEWARRFRADAPVSYREALDFAMEPQLRVFLRQIEESVEPQWIICVEERPEFWMDAFESRSEAVALCKVMGWRVVRP